MSLLLLHSCANSPLRKEVLCFQAYIHTCRFLSEIVYIAGLDASGYPHVSPAYNYPTYQMIAVFPKKQGMLIYIFFKNSYLVFCLWVYIPTWVYIHHVCAGACKGLKWATDPRETLLWKSYYESPDVGHWEPNLDDLCKSTKYYSPPSLPSRTLNLHHNVGVAIDFCG